MAGSRNFQGSRCKKAFPRRYTALMADAHHSESPTARWLLHQKMTLDALLGMREGGSPRTACTLVMWAWGYSFFSLQC